MSDEDLLDMHYILTEDDFDNDEDYKNRALSHK